MNSNDLPALLTEPEAAALVGIKPRTWRRMTRSGVAPAPIRLGKGERPMIRFRTSELKAWLDSGCPIIDSSMKGTKR